MTMANVFVLASKLAGLLFTVSVAANSFAYSKFRKRNLMPFVSPIDESADILADFNSVGDEGDHFFFGLATAPAHVEDKLDDAWLQFAEEKPCENSDDHSQNPHVSKKKKKKKKTIKLAMEAMIRGIEQFITPIDGDESEESESEPESVDDHGSPSLGGVASDGVGKDCSHNVAAWHNVPSPEERLKFWSEPDIELKLAKDTGISVYRMGIDWSRIMPKEPSGSRGDHEHGHDDINFAALDRYRWIVERAIRFYGMKVMITLFHHSLPPWAGEYGGWKEDKTIDYFLHFTRVVVNCIGDLVDYWITFNEPHIYCALTYCAGSWPGGNPDVLESATSALPMGVFHQVMRQISVAHLKAYDCIHNMLSNKESKAKARVGVAHHVSFTRPYGLFDVAAAKLSTTLTVFPFVDSVCEKLEFMGINYYGQEVIAGAGLMLADDCEYSESGRGVYPDGLYRVLLQFHDRYKHLNIPIIITENGVSDATDFIRRPYLLEHLLAIYGAIKMGVSVIGYFFWTTSDNWEWADGYGPKFGLVEVDRANGLMRRPRPSYHLFSKVVKNGIITKLDRGLVWNQLQWAIKENKTRPFCRAVDRRGLMYAGGLDVPSYRPYAKIDWRFGHYEMDGLQDSLSCALRSTLGLFSQKKDKRPQLEEQVESLLLPTAN